MRYREWVTALMCRHPLRYALLFAACLALMIPPAGTLIGIVENRSWYWPSYVLPLMGVTFAAGFASGLDHVRRERKRRRRASQAA